MRDELKNMTQGVSLQTGSPVVFRVGDAICPDTETVLRQVGPDANVCGEIVFFSDRGDERAHFAIISAAGIDTPLVVPVTRLQDLADLQTQRPGRRPDGDLSHRA